MKKLFALCLLAACELQPAPKQAPPVGSAAGSAVVVEPTTGVAAGSPARGSAVVAAGSAAPAAGAAAGSAARPAPAPPPAVQPTADCEKAAVRFADLFIAGAPASQRGIYEQDRANTVRRTEIACTQQGWSPAALACIDQSKNDRDARACLEKFPPPGTKPPIQKPPRD